MAIISTQNIDILAIQSAYAVGSEFEASSLIAVGIIMLMAMTSVIVMAIVAYNAQALREGKIRDGAAADVIKRIVFALLFFVLIISFIGVFYAF